MMIYLLNEYGFTTKSSTLVKTLTLNHSKDLGQVF
jgi:hypothetical protein